MTRCCQRIHIGKGSQTEYCNKPSVTAITMMTEVREGWKVTTEFPVCANCYQYRTKERWVTSEQLSMLSS